MKLKGLPQKLLRKGPSQTTASCASLPQHLPDHTIGYCWFLYHTGRLWRRLPRLLKHYGLKCLAMQQQLSGRGQRIITVLGIYLQVASMSSNPNFYLAVASNAGLRRVTEGVLIARVADRPGVGPLDISLSYLAVY